MKLLVSILIFFSDCNIIKFISVHKNIKCLINYDCFKLTILIKYGRFLRTGPHKLFYVKLLTTFDFLLKVKTSIFHVMTLFYRITVKIFGV